MANPLISDTFMGFEIDYTMELSEASEMDVNIALSSNLLQSDSQTGLDEFWGTNLEISESSYQIEVIDHLSQHPAGYTEMDISQMLEVVPRITQHTDMDLDMADSFPKSQFDHNLPMESEAEYLLDVFALTRQDATEDSYMDPLTPRELITQETPATGSGINIIDSIPSDTESQLKLDAPLESEVEAKDDRPSIETEPLDSEAERKDLCSIWSDYDHHRGVFNTFEDMDPESLDHYISGVEAESNIDEDAEDNAELEAEPHVGQEVHSDERPFHCQWPSCDQSYKYQKNLTAHLRLKHLNGGVHTCERCGMRFLWKAPLDRHMRRKFPCKPAKSPTASLPAPPLLHLT